MRLQTAIMLVMAFLLVVTTVIPASADKGGKPNENAWDHQKEDKGLNNAADRGNTPFDKPSSSSGGDICNDPGVICE